MLMEIHTETRKYKSKMRTKMIKKAKTGKIEAKEVKAMKLKDSQATIRKEKSVSPIPQGLNTLCMKKKLGLIKIYFICLIIRLRFCCLLFLASGLLG